MAHLPLVLLAVAPAVAILAYYLRVVRSAPEPPLAVAVCCVAGGLGFFAAATIEPWFASVVPRSSPWAWAFLVVAPVEELVKVSAILIASRPARYERVTSGIVYGVAAGCAFACVENVAYVTTYGATTGVMRALTTVPAHALHGAIVGLGLGLWHRTERRVVTVALALLVASVLHGAYDGLLVGAERIRALVVLIVVAEFFVVRYALRRALEHDLGRDMDRLATAPPFRDVPTASLRVIASGATRERVQAGAWVVKQGRVGDAMFLILRGRFAVRVDGEHVRDLGAGDFFGELALLTGAPRSADVIAAEEAHLLRVSRATFLRAVRRDPELARIVVDGGRARLEVELPTPEALVAEAAALGETAGLAQRLAGCGIFAALSPPDIEALAKACVTVRQRAGTKLVRAGRAGPGLCVLLAGQAEVRVEAERVALTEGDDFGEINLLTGWTATATVVARSTVELAALRWVDLERVLAENPALGRRLLDSMASSLSRARGAAPVPGGAGRVWAMVGRVGRSLSPMNAKAEALYLAFPSVRTLPRSAVETLARIAEPGEGEGVVLRAGDARWRVEEEALLDGIARCPHILRFLARELTRDGVQWRGGEYAAPPS